MLGYRRIVAERLDDPLARGGGITHRLQRRECLGRYDEQSLACIKIAGRLIESGAIHICDEAEFHRPDAEGA